MHLFSCLTGKLNKLTGKLYISPPAKLSTISFKQSSRNCGAHAGTVILVMFFKFNDGNANYIPHECYQMINENYFCEYYLCLA